MRGHTREVVPRMYTFFGLGALMFAIVAGLCAIGFLLAFAILLHRVADREGLSRSRSRELLAAAGRGEVKQHLSGRWCRAFATGMTFSVLMFAVCLAVAFVTWVYE